MLRSIIAEATFDEQNLSIKKPDFQMKTGIKMASPRGVEPLLPP